jgi:hypothetical protein
MLITGTWIARGLRSQTKQFDGMFSVDRPPAPPGRRRQESHRCLASNTLGALGTDLGAAAHRSAHQRPRQGDYGVL